MPNEVPDAAPTEPPDPVPELIEAEVYRAALDPTIGRAIAAVRLHDPAYLRMLDGDVLSAAAVGATITGTWRHGKLVGVDLDSGHTLGLRFGMTGRLVVDGVAPIVALEYGSARDEAAWDRVVVDLAGGGGFRMNDPRRLGSIELDPDRRRLGPDATVVTAAELLDAFASDRAVKAVLLDQSRVAGLGNLLVDETLWRAGIDPARSARSLTPDVVAEIRRVMRRTISTLTRRGGSHRGDLQEQRFAGGRCPRDGTALLRRTIGGRTTLSCPLHQV